jgi:hypothetical protein
VRPLPDSAKNDDFLPGSIIGGYAADQRRFNYFIKTQDDRWAFVTEDAAVPVKIHFRDIITGSMSIFTTGGLWVILQVTPETRTRWVEAHRSAEEMVGAIYPA